MKKQLFFVIAVLSLVYACQKESTSLSDLTSSGLAVSSRGDSLNLDSLCHNHLDSTHHPFDSLWHHNLDSLWHNHLDSLWHDHLDSM